MRACFEDHWGHVARLFDEDLECGRHNWNTNPSFDPRLWSLAVAGDEIIGVSFARPAPTWRPPRSTPAQGF